MNDHTDNYDALVTEALDRLRTAVADSIDDVVAQLEDEGLAYPTVVDALRADLTDRWRPVSVGFVCPVAWCGRTAEVDLHDADPTCAGNAEGRGAHDETRMVRAAAQRADVPDLRHPLA